MVARRSSISGRARRRPLAIAYNNRGNAYAAKGDYDRAIQDFDQSIKLNPAYAKPFNNRGVAYLKKGEYDLAIKNLDEAIRLNPNYGGGLRQPCRSLPEKERVRSRGARL